MLVVEAEDARVVDGDGLVTARLESLGACQVVGEAVEHLMRASVLGLVARPVVVAAHVPDDVRVPLGREAVEVEPPERLERGADDLLVGGLAHRWREVSVLAMSNKDSMKRFYEAISEGDTGVVDELLADDC